MYVFHKKYAVVGLYDKVHKEREFIICTHDIATDIMDNLPSHKIVRMVTATDDSNAKFN